MLKFGKISSIDVAQGTARVFFEDEEYVSAPLKIAVMRSGKDQVYFPFNVDEHVYCLMDEGMEYGVICGAVYDEKNKPSAAADGLLSIRFGDSSAILFNRNTSTLTIDVKEKVNIKCQEADLQATTKIDITAPMTKITGALTVTGVIAMGGMAPAPGATSIPGADVELNVAKVVATDDVKIGGLSIKSHKHVSAASGSPTGLPIP